jgi:hypothetical protein
MSVSLKLDEDDRAVIWFIYLFLAFSFMCGLFPPREKFVGKNIIVLKMPHMSIGIIHCIM